MYTIKYRKPGQWLWRTLCLTGHQYLAEHDKMLCSLKDGGSYELPASSKCEIRMSKQTLETLAKMRKDNNANATAAQEQTDQRKDSAGVAGT